MIINELQRIAGIDVPVEELGITLHQPKIREIAILGEQEYFIALSLFRLNKERLKISSKEVTNWKIFQESLKTELKGVKNTQVLISNFLQLFFVEKIILGPRSIIVQVGGDQLVNIAEDQFDLLQEVISQVSGQELLSNDEEEFKPKGRRAAEIAEKIKKGRQRRQKLTGDKGAQSFLAKQLKSLAIVTSNSLNQLLDMTIFQINELFHTYVAWEEFDLEIKNRLAGAKIEGKTVHWMQKERKTEASGDTI